MEQGDDTTEHNNQDLTSTSRAATHDADTSSCFDEAPADEPESWVDYMKEDTHKVDELVTANRNTSWILRVRQIYARQATIIAKHHKDRWTKLVSYWNPARSNKQKGHRKQARKTSWQDDITENNDVRSDITWLTAAEDTVKWESLDSDIINSRLKHPQPFWLKFFLRFRLLWTVLPIL